MESIKEPNAEQQLNVDKTSPPQNKAKPLSSFTPLNDKSNHNIMSRQNSAFKDLKKDIKSDTVNIFPNATPQKPQNCEYFNSIISPFKDIPFIDSTPYKPGNYNISSPENLRFNSPMNGNILSESKNFFCKNNNEIQGKRIDFTAESIDMIKLNNKMPLAQPSNGFNNNRFYNNLNNINNINNYLFNQNNINIINNNIDYTNQKLGISPNHNNATSFLNNNNYLNNMSMNNINSINNTTNKCTCSKTGCKKKYCACFSRGKYCDGCECKNCENVPNPNTPTTPTQNFQKIEDSNENPKSQKVICNCTKSNCMKKYCECFKQGFNCNSLCRCWDCKNNKIYINNNMTISNNNDNANYNMKANINLNNNNNENNGYNNYMNNNNDSISTNNFYNYALHNNINNNIINNNIINNSYIPETFGKSLDYSNPMNFQSEAFGICIKKYELKYKPRKLNLNEKENANMKEAINNNFSEINETPKFSNKKRLRTKNDNSTGVKTCPTTNSNSGNKLRKANPVVNKHIKKKRLQLS